MLRLSWHCLVHDGHLVNVALPSNGAVHAPPSDRLDYRLCTPEPMRKRDVGSNLVERAGMCLNGLLEDSSQLSTHFTVLVLAPSKSYQITIRC